MKKFVLLLGIVMMLIGLRLHYNWTSYIDEDGELTVYHKGGEVTTYTDNFPTLLASGKTVRIDIKGGKEVAKSVLRSLSAKTLWREEFESVTVIYAYSDKINGFTSVLDKKVNLMIAIGEGTVAVGSPILKGSY